MVFLDNAGAYSPEYPFRSINALSLSLLIIAEWERTLSTWYYSVNVLNLPKVFATLHPLYPLHLKMLHPDSSSGTGIILT
jgi:hypothetical protein